MTLALTFDPLFFPALNLIGLVLGIIGSLFLTYDFLGRPGGPLRWFLRIMVPTLLSMAILTVVMLIYLRFFLFGYGSFKNQTTRHEITGDVLALLPFGAILGTYNGVFVSPFAKIKQPQQVVFSWHDGILGFLIAFAYTILLGGLFRHYVASHQDLGNEFNAIPILVTLMLLFSMFALFWRAINRHSIDLTPQPRRFILWRVIVGGVIGYVWFVPLRIAFEHLFGIGIHAGMNEFLPDYDLFKNGVRIIFILIGAGVGGFSKYLLWWLHQPPKDPVHPGVLTRKGMFSGALIGLTMPIAISVVLAIVTEVQSSQSFNWQTFLINLAVIGIGSGVAIGMLVGLPVGAISGGISQYLFWNINALPENSILAGGVVLILVGFAVQAIQPLLQLLLIAST
jgi:hypothetical protein